MEPPNSFDADAVRTEKHKVLEAVHPLDDAEVRSSTVRGQYGAGEMAGKSVKAYREEPGVAMTAGPRLTSRCVSVSIIGAGQGCRFTCAPASGSRGARPKSRFSSSRRPSRCSATLLSIACRPTFLLFSC